MAWPVIPVGSGGLPVTEAAQGTPYEEATNGFGVAVTFGSYGTPVTSLRGMYSSNLKLSNTSNFRTVYRAGSRNTRVAFIGDSTFRGQSFGVGTAQAVNAFPMQLATLLHAAGINAGANNVWGDGGSWGLAQTAANFVTGDSRVVFGGSFALGSVKGAGGNDFRAAAAGTFDFTPQGNVNAGNIIWRDGALTRDYNWQVDGGSTTLVQSTGATQFALAPMTLGSVGAHTIRLNWVGAGAVDILGIDTFDNTRKELSLWNWGICGGTSANLIDNTDAAVGRLAILANASLKPDLAFIEGGLINDWRTSVAVATSKANLTTLVTTVKANGGDVILCVPVFDNGVAGLTASQQQYVDAMYQVSFEQNVGLIDIRRKWVSYAAGLASGYYNASDTVHPTTAGYLDMATVTRNVIQAIV